MIRGINLLQESARTFQDLLVWQKAHKWVVTIYLLTKEFPRDELFGLTSQLRRAAVSIPANIAEGFKRRGSNDKARFYNIAQSSLEECRYYLILTNDLGYGNCSKFINDLEVISKMLEKYYLGAKNWTLEKGYKNEL
jgi:four helix bundle protein